MDLPRRSTEADVVYYGGLQHQKKWEDLQNILFDRLFIVCFERIVLCGEQRGWVAAVAMRACEAIQGSGTRTLPLNSCTGGKPNNLRSPGAAAVTRTENEEPVNQTCPQAFSSAEENQAALVQWLYGCAEKTFFLCRERLQLSERTCRCCC